MKIYLVGGACRDILLGLKPKDNDYVVVGSTPEEMLSLGYLRVGSAFPVFLHPETKEEYALARSEKKTGVGYNGFKTDFNPSITLEMDLARRDCTINSMAMDLETGEIIDPFNGQSDLKLNILRHTTEAFAEDPVRVLRVARFAARYGFTVHHTTERLMRKLVHNDEVAHLTAERVWQETENAMKGPNPDDYFQVLDECGALKVLIPELYPLKDNTFSAMARAYTNGFTPEVIFSTLLFSIGDKTKIEEVCTRIRAPNTFKHLAEVVGAKHHQFIGLMKLPAPELWELMHHSLDVIRRPNFLESYANACEAIHKQCYLEPLYLNRCASQVRSVTARNLENLSLLKGGEIQQALTALRINKLALFRQHYSDFL